MLFRSLERVTKVKNDFGYSEDFVRMCLDRAGWRVSDIDLVGLHSIWEPALADFQGFPRPITPIQVPNTVGAHAPVFYKTRLLGRDIDACAVNHHVAHACSAYFTSPFDRSTILIIDARGDDLNFSIFFADGVQLHKIVSLFRPLNTPMFWEGVCSNNYKMVRKEPAIAPGQIGRAHV